MWGESLFCYMLMYNFYLVLTLSSVRNIRNETKEGKKLLSLDFIRMLQAKASVEDGGNKHEDISETAKIRVKRQSAGGGGGAGKFSEAAHMTETRQLRLFLQMFRNLWASSYIGGAHPLHPDVPKPIVLMFKERIYNFLFPPVGAEVDEE